MTVGTISNKQIAKSAILVLDKELTGDDNAILSFPFRLQCVPVD